MSFPGNAGERLDLLFFCCCRRRRRRCLGMFVLSDMRRKENRYCLWQFHVSFYGSLDKTHLSADVQVEQQLTMSLSGIVSSCLAPPYAVLHNENDIFQRTTTT